ncbi:MAG: bifunctional phosphoglucose/phosphomannose isomerase [Candidatus Pacebacteria bacterium]|nr:bifunctional phosphoglucose/phosphomannose isomerase [Candidatus Paceibacterota bacterium]
MKNENSESNNMRRVILDFPKQFRVGLDAVKKTVVNRKLKNISNIIICAMGGSALPGNVLKSANANLRFTKLPIFIHRDYGLPSEAKKESLIICISYSGDTEETISAFREARKRNLKMAVITSGGKILNLAKRNNIPLAIVPFGIQPRCALGYQFASLAKILSNFGAIKSIDRQLLAMEKSLKPERIEQSGKKIAKKLKNSIPVIYSSGSFSSLAKIWKIKFNENSKIPSFFNFFPELNHNEMVGIGETKLKEAKKILKIIIIRDKNEDRNILKRMSVMANILKEKKFDIFFIDVKEKGFFEKFFSNILLGDWVSYYLALFQKIDPNPVLLVEEFKKKIK